LFKFLPKAVGPSEQAL